MLTVPEVLLFTILTPLHVTLIEDALNRRFNPWALVAALVAVAGAGVIRFDSISPDFFKGFLLLQLGNFTYAAGQVLYKRLVARYPSDVPHYRRFGFFYLGALAVVLPAFLLFGKANFLPEAPLQWGVLVFLGLISTALGLYWWNKGACMVRVGTLAVMNILHVPVGLLISLLIWNQHESLGRLFVGAMVIVLAVWISRLDRRAVTV